MRPVLAVGLVLRRFAMKDEDSSDRPTDADLPDLWQTQGQGLQPGDDPAWDRYTLQGDHDSLQDPEVLGAAFAGVVLLLVLSGALIAWWIY